MVAIRAVWGSPLPYDATTLSYTSQALGTQGTSVGRIAKIDPPDGSFSDTITHIGFRVTSTAGTPAAGSYKVGIQGVTAAGVQDGVYLASAVFTPAAGVTGAWVWVALDTPLVVSRADILGIILERVAATDAANAITVGYAHSLLGGKPGFPYATFNSGSGNGPLTNACSFMAVKSAGKIYGLPASDLGVSLSYGGTTEVGGTFVLPADIFASAKCAGVRYMAYSGSTGTATRVVSLYATPTGTPSILAQTELEDVDWYAQRLSTSRETTSYFSKNGAGGNLTDLPTLVGGTKYGVGFAYSASSQGALYSLSVASTADLAAYHTGVITQASRTLASYPPDTDMAGFVEVTTNVLYAELILVDVTPAGTGGGGISAYGFAQ